MINIQNEIKYAVAYAMLKKLYMDGMMSAEEFAAAHKTVIYRFGPEAVRRLP